ncbi:Aste57867_18161 [Aphanomyces stellatus]|uniref:Tubulin--tyrosine ligase-like protein 5 n=1 Tax=Aphanomyces stellatus TaxID=120398 RepID=A0A485L9M1_9STRA|nr:hypothetical protein As57867_018099 [Aphanomyces stellatus]VFT94899.1 Aste57867_18161 [Aphanomyces stellatus]
MLHQWTAVLMATTVLGQRDAPQPRTSKVFLLPEAQRFHLEPVLDAFRALGVVELNDPIANSWGAAKRTQDFDFVWSYQFTEFRTLGPIAPHHKINHLPGNYAIVVKGQVYENQLRLQEMHGKAHFDFIPPQYRLPDEQDKFLAAFAETNTRRGDPSSTDPHYGRRWLIKNQNHRGVHFFSGLTQLAKYVATKDNMVAQCIEPLLISGHKFDIGLYVVVSSVDPLRVYIYENALLRMCKLKYPANLDDSAELQSYVVDDYLPPWEMPDLKAFYESLPTEADEGTSHFAVLKQYLATVGIDPAVFQREIHGAVVKLVAGNRGHFMQTEARMRQANRMAGRGNFFEMFRFDFLVDDKGKPWLMEVNQSPNLAPKYFDSGTDAKMKRTVVHDLIRLVGPQSPADAVNQPNRLFQTAEAYCESKCQDKTRVVDMTCWRCPGWFSPPEAAVLYESATEYLRRGRYNLVFPALDHAYEQFLEDGPTSHDHAFARYIASHAAESQKKPEKKPNVLGPAVLCANRGTCSMHGDCVNGQCVCDDGFDGLTCADLKIVELKLPKKDHSAKLIDDLKTLHSANLRVVGAATPSDSSRWTIAILAVGNGVALCAIYVVARLIYAKKTAVKEH